METTRREVPGVIEGYREVEPPTSREADVVTIDATNVHYRQVNEAVRAAVVGGARTVRLSGVNGQRYIGAGIREAGLRIEVRGTAGNDLAMFMDGPSIEVFGTSQDGVGNTMTAGEVVVHGDAGDVAGYGMRGGRVFIRGDVGYRVGIHMKAFDKHVPVLVCGGKARDFFGEYMAGGVLVLLGVETQFPEQPLVGGHLGAGMHGGVIYLRGTIESWQHGPEVGVTPADEADMATLRPLIERYAESFGRDAAAILEGPFTRVTPLSSRPYAKLYAAM